jgi:GTP cyclohydrolase II
VTISSMRPGFRDAPGAIDVERAISEIRSGRPVVVHDDAAQIVALASKQAIRTEFSSDEF